MTLASFCSAYVGGNERKGDLSLKIKEEKERGGKGGLRNDCTGNAIIGSADQLFCLCGKPRYCFVVLFKPSYLNQ